MCIRDSLYTQLICDFIHVHPAALRIAIEEMGKDHVIAITDAISGTGLGDCLLYTSS